MVWYSGAAGSGARPMLASALEEGKKGRKGWGWCGERLVDAALDVDVTLRDAASLCFGAVVGRGRGG